MAKQELDLLQFSSGRMAQFRARAPQVLLRTTGNTSRRPARIARAFNRMTTQIETQMRLLGRHLPIKCAAVLGGTSMGRQIEALRRGVDLLVAAPGRLEDLWQRGCVSMPRIRS